MLKKIQSYFLELLYQAKMLDKHENNYVANNKFIRFLTIRFPIGTFFLISSPIIFFYVFASLGKDDHEFVKMLAELMKYSLFFNLFSIFVMFLPCVFVLLSSSFKFNNQSTQKTQLLNYDDNSTMVPTQDMFYYKSEKELIEK